MGRAAKVELEEVELLATTGEGAVVLAWEEQLVG